ncbi:transcriptional regulator [uncultured Phocaeicola sp.]|uniref:transcriptional regulator n=1 Tax=uncultured Phocaeicola sp. TaxID=990718 RepID=UPI002608D415|nr:transcriptional regulator [uncultured Phocaeicola sp.]
METNRKVEFESQVLPLNNQNITSEAPKLLPCSSIVSVSDPGSNQGTTFTTGIGKERSHDKWHYLFLHNKELKRYIEIFTGKKSVMIKTPSGSKEERHFCFKVFSYTTADHKRRFEQCPYNKEEYQHRRTSAHAVREAFTTGSTQILNALTDEKEITGDGYLFVCAPLEDLNLILVNMLPRQYLVTDYNTHRAAVIPQRQMEEFIYLYESMPYNIELMDRPLEDYLQKKQRIRITGGVFRGKEGCIMRLHRNTRLVFAFGNMTVAVSYLHAFPFEKID